MLQVSEANFLYFKMENRIYLLCTHYDAQDGCD